MSNCSTICSFARPHAFPFVSACAKCGSSANTGLLSYPQAAFWLNRNRQKDSATGIDKSGLLRQTEREHGSLKHDNMIQSMDNLRMPV